jgi:methanogenic corrinoid protein MtbC1
MSGELVKLLSNLKEKDALEYVERALGKGVDPLAILGEAREGMKLIGEKFADEEYFIPDLIFSGEILKGIVGMLKPHLKKEEDTGRRGKIVIGTVAGDIHDIGKNLVVFMLDASGFEVVDLGVDVPENKFVNALKETGSTVIGLSGFLTLAFQSMKRTIDSIREAGLGDVKIMIGGGQIDDRVRDFSGADAYGKDAMEAVKLAKGWIGG